MLKLSPWTLLTILVSTAIITAHLQASVFRNQPYEWAVLGAGPAGIAAVASLLDYNVKEDSILWIDTEFGVGRLGKFYGSVPSNSPAEYFLKFIASSPSFSKVSFGTTLNKLQNLPKLCWAQLKHIAGPLQRITQHFLSKVSSHQGLVTNFKKTSSGWRMETQQGILHAQNLVLATGSKPKQLTLPAAKNATHLPLDYALNRQWLKSQVSAQDTVAVFGSSHSAVLVMRHLWLLGVKAIINFYRSPLIYAHYKDATEKPAELIHPYDGLKGLAAEWASTVLEKDTPANIIRITSTPENTEKILPSCTKVIYAVGYERNPLPFEDVVNFDAYDGHGIIAPGLFGVGIAFPQDYTDIEGNTEKTIGITDFLLTIKKSIPFWFASTKGLKKARTNNQ